MDLMIRTRVFFKTLGTTNVHIKHLFVFQNKSNSAILLHYLNVKLWKQKRSSILKMYWKICQRTG
jgi:hypothetical protein